ncbi:DUF4179 domain-containing protein [Paenibacillus kobensis]|uniref:DUF4179 domain-containing protein n=1 Tax=Paenibacillus kobensis TaxID=59841 RepID=UPI0013E2AAD5|nr:DUF4179 domain-containing protein [Paenibacillus kobensis]
MKRVNDRESGKTTDWNDLIDTIEAESWERDIVRIQETAVPSSDLALQEAIRKGLKQGRRMGRRKARKRYGYGMAAGLLGIFLLMTAFTRVSPAFAAMLEEIPILHKYVDLISTDSSLRLAVENEFLQPVGVSDEHNGKKMTIPFIMTDGQRLVLFYSLEGTGITKGSQLNNTVISGVNGEELPGGYYSWSTGADTVESIGAKYEKLDIYLQEGTELPNRVKFKAESEGEAFEVEFNIDHSLYKDMREEYNVDKEFQIGGQLYRVDKLIVTPMQASVFIQGAPGNTKKTNSLKGLALEDEKGRRWTSSNGLGAIDEDGIQENFYSSYFEKPKHLTLVAEGAQQNERGKKLVVDTEKLLTLETPDQRLKLKQIEPDIDGNSIKIVFEVSNLSEAEGTYMYYLFNQSKPFTDGSGKSYSFTESALVTSETHQSQDGPDEQITTYVIPKHDYKQPLTFELDQYPGYVNESVRVPIR